MASAGDAMRFRFATEGQMLVKDQIDQARRPIAESFLGRNQSCQTEENFALTRAVFRIRLAKPFPNHRIWGRHKLCGSDMSELPT